MCTSLIINTMQKCIALCFMLVFDIKSLESPIMYNCHIISFSPMSYTLLIVRCWYYVWECIWICAQEVIWVGMQNILNCKLLLYSIIHTRWFLGICILFYYTSQYHYKKRHIFRQSASLTCILYDMWRIHDCV